MSVDPVVLDLEKGIVVDTNEFYLGGINCCGGMDFVEDENGRSVTVRVHAFQFELTLQMTDVSIG